MRSNGLAVVILGIAITTCACRSEHGGPAPDPPPIALRTSWPPDSSFAAFDPGPVTLVATLTREAGASEFHENWIFPAPLSTGALENDGVRVLRWYDVIFDPSVKRYTWFMDGPDFIEPIVIRIHPDLPDPEDGSLGGAITLDTSERSPEGIMIFVMAPAWKDLDLPEGTRRILGLPVVAAQRLGPPTEMPGHDPGTTSSFEIHALERLEEYLLVAIEDTNEDGWYTVGVDWWGYPRAGASSPVPDLIQARNAALDGRPVFTTFTVVRPGQLQPEDF